MATAGQFRAALTAIFDDARSEGRTTIDVKAGDLHRRVGGYPGPKHSMPVCCSVMRALAEECECEVVYSLPSGKGASLTIRYHLKADVPIPDHKPDAAERQYFLEKLNTSAEEPSSAVQAPHSFRMLVVGSCTGEKDFRDCPFLIAEDDFDDPIILQRRGSELAKWALPAGRIYTGRQHQYMMNGVDLLRRKFGISSCSVKIISAGYGLVDEEQAIVPYEATFQRKSLNWIRDRARHLGIPEQLRAAVQGYECVMFLLGKQYLLSISPPLRPVGRERLVFFTSDAQLPFDPSSIIVPAGRAETHLGAATVALKGKMFEHFAVGLCRFPEMWDSLRSDGTPSSVLKLIEIGQREA
jgi:hypothetical protein